MTTGRCCGRPVPIPVSRFAGILELAPAVWSVSDRDADKRTFDG